MLHGDSDPIQIDIGGPEAIMVGFQTAVATGSVPFVNALDNGSILTYDVMNRALIGHRREKVCHILGRFETSCLVNNNPQGDVLVEKDIIGWNVHRNRGSVIYQRVFPFAIT